MYVYTRMCPIHARFFLRIFKSLKQKGDRIQKKRNERKGSLRLMITRSRKKARVKQKKRKQPRGN